MFNHLKKNPQINEIFVYIALNFTFCTLHKSAVADNPNIELYSYGD